jgi:pimeloyl-ACP methyl ester carboxylesterase
MPTIRVAGNARLYYEIEGSGPLVFLLHGGTGTGAYDWEHLRGPLARNHRVVVPDMRGHGRSSDPEWLLGPEAVGDDMLALADHLGARPAATIAFSVGASSMLTLLLREPRATGALVAIAPSLHPRPDRVDDLVAGPWPRDLTELHHEHGTGPDHWLRLREQMARAFWRDFPTLTDEELATIATPLLAVWGDRDPIEPVETGLRLARAVMNGQLLVLPGAGHFIPRGRAAELVPVIERFLSRTSGQGDR